ncbi:MAG: glutamine synthetase family protein [Candidatus Aminicenantes bacterium]
MEKSLKKFGYSSPEDVLKTVLDPENRIAFIRVIFPDILGRHMDFSIPSHELGKAFEDGKGFDGSSVEGFVRIEESDLVIKPDASTFRILPWVYQGFYEKIQWREAVMFGDVLTSDGKPYEGDTRYVLKRNINQVKSALEVDDFKVGPELEFFLFPDEKTPSPMDEGGYFFGGKHGEIRKEIQLLLKMMGIHSEYDHHEVANGQHEIDLRYLSALEMADVCMLFRYMVKKVARMHGLYATFMPKPLNGQNGNGMHVHQSLWKKEKNLFFDKGSPYHLSDTARRYMAGLMRHADDISPVFCQWINSYKRLIEGYEAPVYVAWGQRNRSAYIRVPQYQEGKEQATRIELRTPDPACNLYLTFAVMLTAGHKGIAENASLPDPVEENIYEMSRNRQKQLHIKTLPSNLNKALDKMEKCDWLRNCLGKHVFHKFISNKRFEIKEYTKHVSREYDKQVSGYETKRYLPVL